MAGSAAKWILMVDLSWLAATLARAIIAYIMVSARQTYKNLLLGRGSILHDSSFKAIT